MGNTRTHTEEERKQKDAARAKIWYVDKVAKEKKTLMNKKWRLANNNAEYLRRYRRLACFKRFLSDVCFYELNKI